MFGIPNFSLNCYFNSLFQLLISSPKFNSTNILDGLESSVLRKLIKQLPQFNLTQYQYLIQLVAKKVQKPISYQCSDEFFMAIIDAVSKPIQNLFKIKMEIHHKCKCIDSTVVEESFSLILPTYDLTTIDSQTTSYCSKCNSSLISTYKLLETNELIYIVIQRPQAIQIPPQISLLGCTYNLIGFINYYGNHYTCTAKRNDKFYTFNDSTVSSPINGPVRIVLFELQ